MNTWILAALALSCALSYYNFVRAADAPSTTKSYFTPESGESTTTQNWWNGHDYVDNASAAEPAAVALTGGLSSSTGASVQAAGVVVGNDESTTLAAASDATDTNTTTVPEQGDVSSSTVCFPTASTMILECGLLIAVLFT
ncbi:hypothetical protein M3Y98_00785600 [Aphelenchoides besseyi]|nr:hypothetical protein M3Y98_00785600 [Aphelenchoides besseyi]KAI6211881.1 hypothetical protein M3Y96_00481100 [Aphelenchoides besseyi]